MENINRLSGPLPHAGCPAMSCFCRKYVVNMSDRGRSQPGRFVFVTSPEADFCADWAGEVVLCCHFGVAEQRLIKNADLSLEVRLRTRKRI